MLVMAELAFVEPFAMSFAPSGGRHENSVAFQAHRHCVAGGAFCIFLLVGLVGIALDSAAMRTFPHIIVDRLELLLEVL